MEDDFNFKSTPDGSPPTGRKAKGTFRDLSLSRLEPEEIDAIDSECIEHGITRREWANQLMGDDLEKFYDIFSRTSEYEMVIKRIDFDVSQEADSLDI